jgi:hypothetical protein
MRQCVSRADKSLALVLVTLSVGPASDGLATWTSRATLAPAWVGECRSHPVWGALVDRFWLPWTAGCR